MGLLQSAHAASPTVAVLYPAIREPFRELFVDIIDGIKQSIDGNVQQYALKPDFSVIRLKQTLHDDQADAIIALGSRGLAAARRLSDKRPFIVGAIVSVPPSYHNSRLSGILLSPDPAILFADLKRLGPRVTDVAVVYNPDRYQWLIDRARKAAAANNLRLHAYAAGSMQRGAQRYRRILKADNGRTQAVWLLQDSSVIDMQASLPRILEYAWNKRVIVFSSNPGLVERGILFALYPDTKGMGRHLGRMIMQRLSKPASKPPGLMPLSNVSMAVNTRTANHLGLSFSPVMRQRFNLVFPGE